MTSLGSEAYVGRLTVTQDLSVTGGVTASHKNVGSTYDLGRLSQNGSVFYLKFEQRHQAVGINVGVGSNTVQLTLTADHGIAVGDTVHVGTNIGAYGGIPAAELQGTHVVTAVPAADRFLYTVPTTATSSALSAAAPIIRIDRYRSIDMHGDGVTWVSGTTLPTPVHTNPEVFFS